LYFSDRIFSCRPMMLHCGHVGIVN